MPAEVITTGTVKFFNSEKGYGFITPSNGGKDVFVHIKDVRRAELQTLREGDRLEFNLKEDGVRGKNKAINLVLK